MRRNEYNIFGDEIEVEPEPFELPQGHRAISDAKPQCYSYSYSNPLSQGALICQTDNWPRSYDPKTHDIHSAYSDRMQRWDSKNYSALCKEYGGEQNWGNSLKHLSDKDLKEFAQMAFKLPEKPVAVRVIHAFNVSNGYSCPVVEAMVEISR